MARRYVGIDLAKRTEERCEVPLVSEREEGLRADISMKEFLKGERVAVLNRLHGLYGQVGIIDVTKKDLQDREGRQVRHGELPEELAGYASILEEQVDLFEQQLE
jgi:hypothetical protein